MPNKTRIEVTPEKNYKSEFVKHLVQMDKIMMSSDDIELREIEKVARTARGNCLIGGLGLGLLPIEILSYRSVRSIDIVENDMDVINLVAESIYKKSNEVPVRIIYADITKWTPPLGRSYDWIYCDWWMEPTEVAYNEMVEFLLRIKDHIVRGAHIDGWMLKRMKEGRFWIP